eukprot:364255-Chlamydomonas_euryale.AAC.10
MTGRPASQGTAVALSSETSSLYHVCVRNRALRLQCLVKPAENLEYFRASCDWGRVTEEGSNLPLGCELRHLGIPNDRKTVDPAVWNMIRKLLVSCPPCPPPGALLRRCRSPGCAASHAACAPYCSAIPPDLLKKVAFKGPAHAKCSDPPGFLHGVQRTFSPPPYAQTLMLRGFPTPATCCWPSTDLPTPCHVLIPSQISSATSDAAAASGALRAPQTEAHAAPILAGPSISCACAAAHAAFNHVRR